MDYKKAKKKETCNNIGLKMRQSEFFTPYRAPAKRKTVEIKYLKRMMQYRYEREQSEPARAYIAHTKRRTVEL